VGGSAQTKAMKKVAGSLRLDLAQYRELAAFAQFGSDLDKATQRQLTRGERMVEILKQDQYVPMPTEKQVAIIFAASKGFLDTVPLDQLKVWERDFLLFLEQKHSAVLQAISTTGKLEDDTVEHLTAAIKEFIASRG
jgi:F-type H+-transporting ATPase subunit alpha